MFRNIMIFIAGILMIGLIGCDLKTPEIRGLVIDAETKQPVENAWVHATMQIKSKTIQGDVSTVIKVEPPHTRSNQKGEFVIPAKEFKKPSFLTSFGTWIENFGLNASTIDDKSGGFFLKEYKGKKEIKVNIYIKPWEEGLRSEKEYNSYLRDFYNYCFSGRFGVEVPAVEGGCDEWELNNVIVKHERFIKRLGEPKTGDQKNNFTATMKRLAYLYKKKGEYEKAMETFIVVREFDRERKMDLWLKEYDAQIKVIKQLINGKKK